MVQVKKADVRDAILKSAFQLFSEKDYASTSLSQIAKRAGASTSNLYVYFPSKLDLLWAVIRPWLFRQIDQLELELQGIEGSRARVERILHVLWGEIPAANNNLAINLVQGVALTDARSRDDHWIVGSLQQADCSFNILPERTTRPESRSGEDLLFDVAIKIIPGNVQVGRAVLGLGPIEAAPGQLGHTIPVIETEETGDHRSQKR